MVFISTSFLCFNSTLVQLKGSNTSIEDINQLCFNSTLVQLKDLERRLLLMQFQSFNSTLVQLKATPKFDGISLVVEFQFYLSSIKSGNPCNR